MYFLGGEGVYFPCSSGAPYMSSQEGCMQGNNIAVCGVTVTSCLLTVLLLLRAALASLLPALPWCCQGGMFIFDGETCVWSHFDQATGAHADFADVIKVADSISSSSSKDCGCST